MSVCFYVPAATADQAGTSAVDDSAEIESIADDPLCGDRGEQQITQFWNNVNEEIRKITPDHFKTQALPLARIKKIMKLDEEVKMISAEAPFLFAKAAEIFIHELTLRAWSHTEDNKRRTLQRNDIAMAISKSDQFDFLIDIVPRHEVKPNKMREDTPRTTVTEQISHTPQSSHHTTQQQQSLVVPCSQIIQQPSASSTGGSSTVPQQPVTLVHQLVTSSGEVQQLPIQLSQAQLNMIRLQMQNNPNQPIIIQAQPQSTPQPQIIQVSSQTQHQNQPQLYITQVSSSQDQDS